ncbi:hypothetical protein N5V81_13255 [Escherichia coli]|nr:hypothetical protein [Escherichia coli]
MTYANLNTMPTKNRYYATFLDYAINYSGLNRARFFTGVVDAGSTINEMNSAMCSYSPVRSNQWMQVKFRTGGTPIQDDDEQIRKTRQLEHLLFVIKEIFE